MLMHRGIHYSTGIYTVLYTCLKVSNNGKRVKREGKSPLRPPRTLKTWLPHSSNAVNMFLSVWIDLIRHANEVFSQILTTNNIQLVAFVGGYLLLRPRLLRLCSRHQACQLHRNSQSVPVPNVSEEAGRRGSEHGCKGEDGWGCRHATTKRVEP